MIISNSYCNPVEIPSIFIISNLISTEVKSDLSKIGDDTNSMMNTGGIERLPDRVSLSLKGIRHHRRHHRHHRRRRQRHHIPCKRIQNLLCEILQGALT
jgi:hypothetical protein